jgi:MHS family proline/betaine transporter-like MFS transporter
MQAWGWRLPFIISVIGSVLGIYIRQHLSDPGVYLQVKARKKQESIPLKILFQSHKRKILLIMFLDFLTAVGFFIIAIFLATYLRTYLKYSETIALSIHTLNMAVLCVATILGGWLSDKFSPKLVMGIPCLLMIILSYPLFELFQSGNIVMVGLSEAFLTIIFGLFFGVIPSALAEIMPTQVRFSGLSIGHNICMALIGGGTPFLATHLLQTQQNLSSPAYLLIAASSVSFISIWFIKPKQKILA